MPWREFLYTQIVTFFPICLKPPYSNVENWVLCYLICPFISTSQCDFLKCTSSCSFSVCKVIYRPLAVQTASNPNQGHILHHLAPYNPSPINNLSSPSLLYTLFPPFYLYVSFIREKIAWHIVVSQYTWKCRNAWCNAREEMPIFISITLTKLCLQVLTEITLVASSFSFHSIPWKKMIISFKFEPPIFSKNIEII